jgi:predicted nucleic acid-binding Zn ribbon protein
MCVKYILTKIFFKTWHNAPTEIAILNIGGRKPLIASARRRSLAAMLKSTSPVEAITSTLERIVGKSLRAAPQTNAPVLAWPVVCGSAVAERTRAIEFARGILTVEVPDAGWRAELQRLAPQYLAVINRYAAKSVNRIEFVVKSKNAEVRMQK